MKTKMIILCSVLLISITSATIAQNAPSVFSNPIPVAKQEVKVTTSPVPANLYIWWVRFKDRIGIRVLPMI